tara:strand:- start:295 stop:525 length:231 start_codon:yes stop_codon:yes gene_type:complete
MAPDPELTAKVMRLRWKKGISLAEAWAKVKRPKKKSDTKDKKKKTEKKEKKPEKKKDKKEDKKKVKRTESKKLNKK